MNKYRKEICNRFEKENPDWKNKSHKAGYVSKLLEYLISKLEQAEKKIEKLLALHNVKESFCGECVYYLTCRHESRDKRICEHYDNQP